MTRNALMILNPRKIPECVASIEALRGVDHVHLIGYTEGTLVRSRVIAGFIESTHYENYLIVSDDVVVNQQALDLVLHALKTHEVATGYCNMIDANGREPSLDQCVNLTKAPLGAVIPTRSAYQFYLADEANNSPTEYFPTWFMGWAFSGMRRDLWLRFPYDVYPQQETDGFGSDYHVSWRLQEAGVPIAAVRGAMIHHLSREDAKRNRIIGQEPPRVRICPSS